MSEFGRLLKNSKFASLSKPLKKTGNPLYPTHQIVETRQAALDRQEWGLKYALPSKVKSRYITFNNVDSLERVVDFETNGGDHWKRLRFQELGLAPALEKQNKNPLFNKIEDSSRLDFDSVLKVSPGASTLELDSVASSLTGLRKEFKDYLLKTNPGKLQRDKLDINKFRDEALTFLKQYKKKQNVNKLESLKLHSSQKVHGFGGLSYNLKGRLTTHPNGIVTHNVAPGRLLEKNKAAVGGFISKVKTGQTSPQQWTKVDAEGESRETVIPLEPKRAIIKPNGSVDIEFSTFLKTTKENIRARKPKAAQHYGSSVLNTFRK